MVYKKKILELNPEVLYMLYPTHSLHLVVNEATKASLEIKNVFTIVPEL